MARKPHNRPGSSTGALSDREIVDYLNQRAYVECTDEGLEDPNRFALDMYPGNFRHAISLHIMKVRAKATTPDEPK
jgi:hypothetical protein